MEELGIFLLQEDYLEVGWNTIMMFQCGMLCYSSASQTSQIKWSNSKPNTSIKLLIQPFSFLNIKKCFRKKDTIKNTVTNLFIMSIAICKTRHYFPSDCSWQMFQASKSKDERTSICSFVSVFINMLKTNLQFQIYNIRW